MSDMKLNQIITTRKDGSLLVQSINDLPTLTDQAHAKDCDINTIMARYQKTGELTHLARKTGIYADLSHIQDYQSMLDQVMAAEDAFMTLPAEARKEFDNDPGKLIAALQNPSMADKLTELGILEPKPIIKNDLNEQKPPTKQSKPKPPLIPPSSPPPAPGADSEAS